MVVAPPKVSRPKKTAKYYRSNGEARATKAKTDTAFNSKPSQMEKRRELAEERRERGIMGKGGKDLSHTKKGKLVLESSTKNRARNRGKK